MKLKLKLHLILAIFVITQLNANSQWNQIGMDIDGDNANNYFGSSVAVSGNGLSMISGTRFIQSSFGQVKVFKNISGTWTQQGPDLIGNSNDGYGSFGKSVDISEDGLTIAIGSSGNDGFASDAGSVKIYKFTGGNWVQDGQTIFGEAEGDESGSSVSLSDNGLSIAIGAPKNSANRGHVRVYKNISGVWTQQGLDIDGEIDLAGTVQLSGFSVSIDSSGTIVAIGAPLNNGNGFNSGHARIYKLIAGTWVQLGIDIDGEAAGDQSGIDVSISDNGLTIAVGATENDQTASNSGHVRVFNLVAGVWTQLGQDIDGEAINDQSGNAVDLSSDGLTVVIGASYNNGVGVNSGHTRVYKYSTGSWLQYGADINGETAGDRSGWSVNISNDASKIIIGANRNDGAGSNAGHVRVYRFGYTSLKENNKTIQLDLYPNPTNNSINIVSDFKNKEKTITITDLSGKLVQSTTTTSDKIDIKKLKTGIYFLNLKTNQGIATKKIIKN